MLPIAYTLTEDIKENLVTVDSLRRLILTTPTSPKNELKLRWQAQLERIVSSLSLSGINVSRRVVIQALTQPKKRPVEIERQILSYKHALDWLVEQWTANPKPLTPTVLETLAILALSLTRDRLAHQFQASTPSLKQLLDYLQTQGEHPVIAAAVAHAQLLNLPISALDGRLGRLTHSLILCKYGYDLRGMLSPEREWAQTPEAYRRNWESISRQGQLTSWIAYCVKTMISSLEELRSEVREAAEGLRTDLPASFWELKDRQKAALSLLEDPTVTITNRQVQKRFKVSQITASRDLTKLVSLGLLFSHGKGRSVYYTRV